jgi:hypothetical protein
VAPGDLTHPEFRATRVSGYFAVSKCLRDRSAWSNRIADRFEAAGGGGRKLFGDRAAEGADL